MGLVCHNCLACKRWWHLECLPPDERGTADHQPCDLPAWLRLWPMLFNGYPLAADYSKWNIDCSSLRLQLAHELCCRLAPPWWRTPCTEAIGQASAAGLWTKELSSQLRDAMPSSKAAQLYSSHWQILHGRIGGRKPVARPPRARTLLIMSRCLVSFYLQDTFSVRRASQTGKLHS